MILALCMQMIWLCFFADLTQLPLVLEYIKFVGCFTGLQLNIDKTIAFFHRQEKDSVVAGVRIWDVPVKYLGVYLGKGDLSHLNFEKPLHAAKAKIWAWSRRQLTLPVRITVLKTFIFSLFVHILNSV